MGVGEEEKKQERDKWAPLWAGTAGAFTASAFLLEGRTVSTPRFSSFPYNIQLTLSRKRCLEDYASVNYGQTLLHYGLDNCCDNHTAGVCTLKCFQFVTALSVYSSSNWLQYKSSQSLRAIWRR